MTRRKTQSRTEDPMRSQNLLLLIPSALLLNACGGGGGGSSNPSPPAPPASFAVGGRASGVAGDGLTLRLNGAQSVAVNADGAFTFPTALTSGTTYTVTIEAQPVTPSQTCALANATGSVAGAVTNVTVTCTTNTYAVGGSVSGLAGDGLVLQINGGSNLAVSADGDFVFGTEVDSGEIYSVTVLTQPSDLSQTCVVRLGGGEIGAADITDIGVDCTTNSFSIGGSISGLEGSGLQVTLNDGAFVMPVANDIWQFTGNYLSGTDYSVSVTAQPTNPHQTCNVSSPAGTVAGANVTSLAVSCQTNTYAVGGTVSGLTGAGLVLQLNGGQDLPVNGDGSFEFPTPVASGVAYSVTVRDQTSTFRELCEVFDADGQVAGAPISDVTVNCSVLLGYAYVAGGVDGVLRTYGIRPDGSMTRRPSTVSVGTSPRELIVAPNGQTLYSVSALTNVVTAAAVDPDRGTLTSLGAVAIGAQTNGAQDLAIEPSGKFLYATNAVAGTVTQFTVDSVTGALSNAAVVATSAAGEQNVQIAITPDGAHLYLLGIDPGTSQSLTVYAIDATTGALTAGTSIDPGVGVEDIDIDALGRTLYVSRVQMPVLDQYETTLQPYEIDAGTGALTPVGSGTVVAGQGQDLALDPTGQYAYVVLASGYPFTPTQRIHGFTIDQSTGALFGIGGYSEFYATPWRMAFLSTGRFLFVGNYNPLLGQDSATWYDVLSYEIGAPAVLPGQLWPGGTGTATIGRISNGALSVIAVVD